MQEKLYSKYNTIAQIAENTGHYTNNPSLILTSNILGASYLMYDLITPKTITDEWNYYDWGILDNKTLEGKEAFNLTNLPTAFLGIFLGIVMMIICDLLVDKKFNKSTRFKDSKNALLKTGIVVSIGLALHNLPEGLAIGSGFGASIKLGLSLAIAICLHDIPEGISMAVPMKNGGMKKSKVIFYVVLSGVTTGIGAFLGALVGGISQSIIAMCLAFAAGAMIYIVSGELTPEANNLYHGRMTAVGSMLGLLIGIFAMSI